MSASEKLAALEALVLDEFAYQKTRGSTRAAMALEAVDAVLPQIRALVEAAEKAERKLWYEYRREGVEPLANNESWAEGEALAEALADLDKALGEQT